MHFLALELYGVLGGILGVLSFGCVVNFVWSFVVVICWKWQRQNSLPQFLHASETVLFYSKHKWKCSCSKWISSLRHSEILIERGKQRDRCCLCFSLSDFPFSHHSNNFTTFLIITLFLCGQKVNKNVQHLEGVLLCRDQDSSSILETVVKLETIWPIYLLVEKQQSPGQLELCLPVFWKSPKLKLTTRC